MTATHRFCAIDYGSKRIGLAITDPEATIATPLTTVAVEGALADQVRGVIEAVGAEDIAGWVIGLPLNMDGTEGPQARRVRQFADVLLRYTEAPMRFWDERLSTFAADEVLANSGLSPGKRRARRDMVAAQIILQSFLDERQHDTSRGR